MERLPNPSNSDRLKASVKALASLFKHEVNLCQSNHYNREHFVPFEKENEEVKIPTLWDLEGENNDNTKRR